MKGTDMYRFFSQQEKVGWLAETKKKSRATVPGTQDPPSFEFNSKEYTYKITLF